MHARVSRNGGRLLLERLQRIEVGGRVDDAVEAAAFAFDRGGEVGMVLRRRAREVHRIDRRRRAAEAFDLVVQRFQRPHLAPEQHDGRARRRRRERARAAEAAGGARDEHDALAQRIGGRHERPGRELHRREHVRLSARPARGARARPTRTVPA
jgi:hypothetical protein